MNTGNRNLLLGTIIGLVVGGVAALLFAPAEGEETRRKIRMATDQACDKAKDMAAKGKEYVHNTQAQLQEAVKAGRHAAEEKREELEKKVHAQT